MKYLNPFVNPLLPVFSSIIFALTRYNNNLIGVDETTQQVYNEIKSNEVEIVKRQTDVENKIDRVYVTLSVNNNDESIQGNIDVKIVYGLYNDGWDLDSCETDYEGENGGNSFIPLKGNEFTLEEISAMLPKLSNEFFSEIEICDYEFLPNKNIEIYHLIGTATYKYLTTTNDMTMTCPFSKDTGKWDTPYLTIDSSDEKWHIDGNYTFVNLFGDSETITLAQNLFSGNYPDRLKGGKIFAISDITPGELFALYVKQFTMDKALKNGYSVCFEGDLDFTSFEYCVASEKSDVLFIGKDNMALYLYGKSHTNENYVLDDYNRKVIIRLRELQK